MKLLVDLAIGLALVLLWRGRSLWYKGENDKQREWGLIIAGLLVLHFLMWLRFPTFYKLSAGGFWFLLLNVAVIFYIIQEKKSSRDVGRWVFKGLLITVPILFFRSDAGDYFWREWTSAVGKIWYIPGVSSGGEVSPQEKEAVMLRNYGLLLNKETTFVITARPNLEHVYILSQDNFCFRDEAVNKNESYVSITNRGRFPIIAGQPFQNMGQASYIYYEPLGGAETKIRLRMYKPRRGRNCF